MPTITAIEPQKKQDRFNIFLDNKFAFGAGLHTIVENGLRVGQKLDQSQIDKVIKNELGSKLMDLAARFLSIRPRSQKEVENYLIKKISKLQNVRFHQAKESVLIPPIITKLKKYNYISDVEFAKWWFVSRTRSMPRSIRVIRLELKQKGVDDSTIDKLLAQTPNEIDLANKLLQKKTGKWLASRSGQKLSKLEYKKKVFRLLSSHGFDYETIKEAFANLVEKG